MTCKMTLNATLNWASWLVVCDFLMRLVWVGTGRSLFPKPAELLAEKRDDLLAAVREQGGVVAVAKRMGLRPQRNGVSPNAQLL